MTHAERQWLWTPFSSDAVYIRATDSTGFYLDVDVFKIGQWLFRKLMATR